MRVVLGLILAFLSLSCEQLVVSQVRVSKDRQFAQGTGEVDDELQHYIELFKRQHRYHTGSEINLRAVSVKVSDSIVAPGMNPVGVCRNSIEVEIDQKFWERASEASREALIFHELGHCVLNKKHNNEMYQDFPISMMHSNLIAGYLYERFKLEYELELFTGDSSALKESINLGY